jgi:hypothetical protein
MESKVIDVICYAGYAADEEPRTIVVDGRRVDVVAVERRWREPDARFFSVRTADGTRYVLRQDVVTSAWTIRS